MTANVHTTSPNPGELAARYAALQAEEPKLRIRNAANKLGVSELELLTLECGDRVTRLRPACKELLHAVPRLGEVMALTRNEAFVHEKIGTYRNVSFDGHVGLVLDEAIDLRIFIGTWKHALAVRSPMPRGGERLSLQFFNAHGEAVHKIFLRAASNEEVYHELVETYRHDDQSPHVEVTARPEPKAETPDAEIDVDGFQAAWRAMTDTHEFFGMTRKYGVSRTQALRLAPDGYARRLELGSFREMLQKSAETELPIMVFVNSPGCIQIHTGPVRKLVETGDWYNVLDPDFNLHARDGLVAEAWHVRKPTEDGDVNSLELFDAQGDLLALLFGARKPGKPELPAWTEMAAGFASLA